MKNKIYKILISSIISFNLYAMEDDQKFESVLNQETIKNSIKASELKNIKNNREIIFSPLNNLYNFIEKFFKEQLEKLPSKYVFMALSGKDKLVTDFKYDNSDIQEKIDVFIEKTKNHEISNSGSFKIRKKPSKYKILNTDIDEEKGNYDLFVFCGSKKNETLSAEKEMTIFNLVSTNIKKHVDRYSQIYSENFNRAFSCFEMLEDLDTEIESEKFKQYASKQILFLISRMQLGTDKIAFDYAELLKQKETKEWSDNTFELNKNTSEINFLRFNIIQSILLSNQRNFVLSVLGDFEKSSEEKKKELTLFARIPDLLSKIDPDKFIEKGSFKKILNKISQKIKYDVVNNEKTLKEELVNYFQEINELFINDTIPNKSLEIIVNSLKLDSQQANQLYQIFGAENPQNNVDLDKNAISYNQIIDMIRASKSDKKQYEESIITGNPEIMDNFSEYGDSNQGIDGQLLNQSMKLSYGKNSYKDGNQNSKKQTENKPAQKKITQDKNYLSEIEEFITKYSNHNTEELTNILNNLQNEIKERNGNLENFKTLQVQMKDGRILSYDVEKPHQSGEYKGVSFLIKGRSYLSDTLGIFERIYFKKNENGSYKPFFLGHL